MLDLSTRFGEVKIVAAPAGAPRDYEALRVGATTEHLGQGLRPDVASIGDLIGMVAALGRPQDLERWPMLRRILELEADRAALVPANLPGPRSGPSVPVLGPVDAEKAALPYHRRSGPTTDPGIGR